MRRLTSCFPPVPAAPRHQCQLFCKGADNIIKSRLSSKLNPPESLARIDEHVMNYVNDGLRTLLLAKVRISACSSHEHPSRRQQEGQKLSPHPTPQIVAPKTQAELSEATYQSWAKRYREAETSIKNRDEKRSVWLFLEYARTAYQS